MPAKKDNKKTHEKSFRMSQETWRQIEALQEQMKETFPDLMIRAIENLYTLRIESKKRFRP